MPNKYINALKNGIDAMIDSLREEKSDTTPIPATADMPKEPVVQSEPEPSEDNTIVEADATLPSTLDTPPESQAPVVEKPAKIDCPDIRVSTYESLPSGGYVAGCSIQGRSHIVAECECQDYHYFENLGNGWMLALVSDGAGSARESARGSKANCEITAKLVKDLLEKKNWIKNNYLPGETEWYIEIRNILELLQTVINHNAAAQAEDYKRKLEEKLAVEKRKLKNDKGEAEYRDEKIIRELEENIKRPLSGRDFNATLILLLLTPGGMLTAHIGDGRMGYLTRDNEWKSLMTPHKGDEASSTVFIPNNWNRQMEVPAFTMSGVYLPETKVIAELPKAFVLMSDGCESFSWNCSAFDAKKGRYYDRNTPFEKFLTPLIDCLNESEEDKRVEDMIKIINVGTEGGRREQDDRTMLLVVAQK